MTHPIYDIDLHGVTMSESKMILDEVFVYVKKHKKIKEVHIIVGTGSRSVNGPVLPSFVMNYLKERHIIATLENGTIRVIIGQ